MSNLSHLDESIVTPSRAGCVRARFKTLSGADNVYRASRSRFSSSPSVCRMKNNFFFSDCSSGGKHMSTDAVIIDMAPPRAPIPQRIQRRFEMSRVEIAHTPNRKATAASAIQRAWRKFCQRGKTMTRLARHFLNLGLSSPENYAEYETYIKLLTRRETITVCASLMAHIDSLAIISESSTARGRDLSARSVLSSYMICHHPNVVLGVDEKDDHSSVESVRELLLYSARKLTRALDTMTKA